MGISEEKESSRFPLDLLRKEIKSSVERGITRVTGGILAGIA